MSEEDLTRRKVLSGMAITGSSGALVGHSTVSLFSDKETFSNNSLTAANTSGGTVNLTVTPVDDDHIAGNESSGERVEFDVTLPQDGRNNPAFICVEGECPCDFDKNPSNCSDNKNLEVADDLEVRVDLQCPDDKLEPILRGSLREVLDVLERGVLLCNETGSCLETGQTLTLALEVTKEYTKKEYNIDIGLTFFAEQCRYNNVPDESTLLENPCQSEGECPPPETGSGIRFIAFCSIENNVVDTVAASSVTILGSLQLDDGQPTSLVWTTDNPVDYVIVFGGDTWTIYDYSNDGTHNQDGPTTGVATTAIPPFDTPSDDDEPKPDVNEKVDGTVADLFYDKNDEFYDDTATDNYQNFEGCNGNSNGNSDPRSGAQNCPCEVASQQLYDESFNGTSVKLEWCDNLNNPEFREEENC